MTVLANARVVTPGGTLDPGWVRIEGERIADVGGGLPPDITASTQDLDRSWVVPGFIDLHLHGGGGASVASADPAEVLRALAFHRRHGTTRAVASLVSAPAEDLIASLRTLEQVRSAPDGTGLIGCHLEGPFLSPLRRGAHDPRHLLPPDEALMARLLEAGDGIVRIVTLAPELPGALSLVRQVISAGAVAALGHTDATYEQAATAFDAGARHVTHLFNGMRPLHHREPGTAIAGLVREGVVCELINDSIHLHDAVVRLVFAAAGRDRVALVTDSIPAAGLPDGLHRLGTMAIRVDAGRATLADGSSIAGSTLTMDRAVRRAVLDLGLPIEAVATAAATTPARQLGLDERVGTLEPGKDADLVVLDAALQVRAVMALGRWVEPPPDQADQAAPADDPGTRFANGVRS